MQGRQSFTCLDSHFALCFLPDCFSLLQRISTLENLELDKYLGSIFLLEFVLLPVSCTEKAAKQNGLVSSLMLYSILQLKGLGKY